MERQAIRQRIIEYAKLCYDKGLVSAAGGNISMRWGNSVFITATNAPLRRLRPENIVEIDMDGQILDAALGEKPSKEWGMHLAVFQKRPDVDSVIHIHPVYSIASTVAIGEHFSLLTVSAQLKLHAGYAPFAKPGSKELLNEVADAIREGGENLNAILLERHGIITFAKEMEVCYNIAELVEETAKINYLSATLKAAVENGGAICYKEAE